MILHRAVANCRTCISVRTLSTASVTLEQLKRRCQRLQQLYGSLQRQPLTHFEVDGVLHTLPLSSVRKASQQPLDQGALEYMCGFFDGDGCVTCCGNYPLLTMAQDVRRAHVLLKFRRGLGGGIYDQGVRQATHMPCLRWCARGETGAKAAAILGSLPCMKQEQLLLAANWPALESERCQAKQELAHLKRKDYRPKSFRCSWPYVAGFFDADGAISLRSHASSVVLTMTQANPFVLERLHDFFIGQNLHRWHLSSSGSGPYRLECTHSDTSQHTLHLLIESGLLLKTQQARLVLALDTSNYSNVRSSLFSMHGRQNMYQRLDSEGIARSREIQRLAASCKRSPDAESQLQLRELRDQHAWKNAERHLLLLRHEIRDFLLEKLSHPVVPFLQSCCHKSTLRRVSE